jgi:hypothetical protein
MASVLLDESTGRGVDGSQIHDSVLSSAAPKKSSESERRGRAGEMAARAEATGDGLNPPWQGRSYCKGEVRGATVGATAGGERHSCDSAPWRGTRTP